MSRGISEASSYRYYEAALDYAAWTRDHGGCDDLEADLIKSDLVVDPNSARGPRPRPDPAPVERGPSPLFFRT